MTLKHLSLKSKLVIMLLGIALCSILIVGFQGLNNGKKALTARIYDQLTSVRESKRAQVESWFNELTGQVKSLAVDHTITRAMRDFKSAYSRLEHSTLDNDQIDRLKTFYQTSFIPQLEKNIHGNPQLEYYFPTAPATQYLQYHYLVHNPKKLKNKALLNDAGDKSYYSGIHAYNHPVLHEFLTNYGYYDLFLIDIETGNIVYSVSKETDFATSLLTDVYRSSNLGRLYQKIRNAPDQGVIHVVDYDFYRASYGQPAFFLGTTIVDEEKTPIGILAIQVSNQEVSSVMTGNKGWKSQGLGDTGESYIVGTDHLMRSDARLLFETETTSAEKHSCYAVKKTAGGLQVGGPSAQKICDLKTSVLLQQVETPVVDKALNGQKGTEKIISYSGKKALAAYSPLQLGDLKFAIISQIDLDEANKPIHAFQKELGISTVILASIITFLAMLLAHFFTKPIAILMQGVRKLSRGNADIHIKLNREDEYGELARVMNNTGKLIRQQQKEIKRKELENKTLLLNILPEKVAQQLEHGETKISEKVSNVSVVYTTLRGFSENLDTMKPEQAITLLNDLIEAFDIAAEKYDIEKVKTIGDSYLAACGLNVSRLDHANRCVQFGQELLDIVQTFNHRQGTRLALRVGIHSGSVLAGVVGKRNFAYDLWGETVNIAGRIRFEAPLDSLVVTEEVYTRLADKSIFDNQKTLATQGMGELEIWVYSKESPADVTRPAVPVQHV